MNTLMPHYCCSCGRIGAVLCEHCKYDIISEPFERCLVCLGPTSAHSQLCGSCHEPYVRAWCVGERADGLKKTIDLYKYKSTRAAAEPLSVLLDGVVPHLPPETRVVPVPTIAPHVRIRGYDHITILARRFAKHRELQLECGLQRVGTSHQQGSTRRQRIAQAKQAFRCDAVEYAPHLLIDDVFTTGATLHYAAKALYDAGASEVYVVVLSRQTLENA